LERLRNDWDELASDDPMWAILSRSDKKAKWSLKEFFETGKIEIDFVMKNVMELQPRLALNTALDFGCGIGRLTRSLSYYFASVDGVDISPTMIHLAKEKNADRPNCNFSLNGKNDLAIFNDMSFDLIYSSVTLQHIPQEISRNYIFEFLRLVKPGGLVVFQLPSHEMLSRFSRIANRNVLSFKKKVLGKHDFEMYGIPRTEVEEILRKRGASILREHMNDYAGSSWKSYTYYVCMKWSRIPHSQSVDGKSNP
jgi:ubiquinone/menaquinone biosynthesis C-methylase UbiE